MHLERFARILRARGIGHIQLLRGVGREDLKALVGVLTRGGPGSGSLGASGRIRLGQVDVRGPSPALDGKGGGSKVHARLERLSAGQECGAEIFEGVRKRRRLHSAGISEVVTEFAEALAGASNPFLALAPMKERDDYTFVHSVNVCILTLAQAMALGIEGPLLHDIGVAAMLHDVGKLFIPGEVLNKPDSLTEEEWGLIRQHPRTGARYLLETPGVPRLAAVAAFEHHIHFEGAGYPRVASGWRQNLCSQLTTVSDFYDAQRTRRAYRDALSKELVAARVRAAAGTVLHPALAANFLQILEYFEDGQASGAAG
ncbi:MAG: HD family phosphohydrolase [Desulfuromonas sp.]|nr:HD domain-containing phosphohydrolase [Desulfuromonas sp.]PLX85483.1 MAG: HD family phosphohydrolase [Desulfuromonas sp.]